MTVISLPCGGRLHLDDDGRPIRLDDGGCPEPDSCTSQGHTACTPDETTLLADLRVLGWLADLDDERGPDGDGPESVSWTLVNVRRTRGGARPGAGRPEVLRNAVSVTLDLDGPLARRLDREVARRKSTRAEVVRAVLDSSLPAPKRRTR